MKVQGILVSPNEFISVELFLILTWVAERDRSCHVTIFVHDIFLKLVIFKPFFPSSQVGVVVATAIIWKKYMSEWWLTDNGCEGPHERMHNPWLWSKGLTDHVSVMWYNISTENTIMFSICWSLSHHYFILVSILASRDFRINNWTPISHIYVNILCFRLCLKGLFQLLASF